MPTPPRVIPIACPFARFIAYAYYIDTPQPVLIDTGIGSSPQQIIGPALAQHGLRLEDVRWVLLTHGHPDHLGGASGVWQCTHCRAQVAIHRDDAALLSRREAHLEAYAKVHDRYLCDPEGMGRVRAILMDAIGGEMEPTRELVGGERLSIGGGHSISVLHTPGHCTGCLTYVLDGPNWAFVGDAVQGCGGVVNRFPSFENPALYRQSLSNLLSDVRPSRMYLAHHYLDAHGNRLPEQVDGESVAEVLQTSLAIENRLGEAARRHAAHRARDDGGLYGPYGAVATEVGYSGDPRTYPSPFFITMEGYREALMAEDTRSPQGFHK